jgi:aryl-alcohol dehydrogenase-like predicted oxidoreductase
MVLQPRTLGSTDLEVSSWCLGTMHFGSRDDDTKSYALLDQYVEAGGNFLDTANMYAMWIGIGGESETLLGKWMKERNNRDRLVIASKVGFQYQDVPSSNAPAIIEAECEKSLKRLGIECIDIYYAHRDDRTIPLEAQLEAFDKLVRAGKVRYIGASNFKAWRLAEAEAVSTAHNWAPFCCVQQRHTYLRPRVDADFAFQTSCNDDLLEYCRERKFPLIAYSPLVGGAYIRDDKPMPAQYDHADSDARKAVLKQVAEELQVGANQVVLAWMISNGILPVTGASTHEQMSASLDAAEIVLSEGQLERLDQAGAPQGPDPYAGVRSSIGADT